MTCSNDPTQDLLSRLKGVRTAGDDQWKALCPAHDDNQQSLSISRGTDGRALVNCHAGCSTKDVCEAVDMSLADLFPSQLSEGSLGTSCPGPRTKQPQRKVYETRKEAVAAAAAQVGGDVCDEWFYTNADGSPCFGIVRFTTQGGDKAYRPISETKAGWTISTPTAPLPLYGLPELVDANVVCIAEGEKCADAARSIGLIATTSAHGAGSAHKSDWTPLAGKEVVICPDNDDRGRHYAEQVISQLSQITPTPIIKVVELPNLPEKGDIVEFIQHRKDAGLNSSETLKEIEEMISAASHASPIEQENTVAEYKPFPVEALPSAMRQYVTAGARAIGCDPAYLALPALAAAAGAIGTTRRIKLKHGWDEPAIIWAIIVGESGTSKSPALDAALRPMREIQDQIMRERQDDLSTCSQLDDAPDDLRNPTDEQDESEPQSTSETPDVERCIIGDITTEALAVMLKNNPRGLLLSRDELAGWITSFGRYTNGKGCDVAQWLELFGGRPLTVDRKTGQCRVVYIPRTAISVCGGIQPEALRRALGRQHFEDGLAARCLMAMPPRRPKQWTEDEIEPDLAEQYLTIFRRLYALVPRRDGSGRSLPVDLPLTKEAKDVWVSFSNEHNRELTALTGDLAAAWAKLEAYCARLALVIHCVRCAEGDVTAKPTKVDAQSMQAAATLVQWFGQEIRRIYGHLAQGSSARDSHELIDFIKRRGGRLTVRDLQQGGPKPIRVTASTCRQALDDLATDGSGHWEKVNPGPRGGRPTKEFVLETTRQ